MLLSNYSIGSGFRKLEAALSSEFSYTFTPVLITRTNQWLPVIISYEAGKIDQAVWGIRSRKLGPEIYPWVRSESIIRNPHTRTLIRNNRCLVPANGFFIQTGTKIFFIYFPEKKIITFGGVWQTCIDTRSDQSYPTFSIISRPAFGKIDQLTRRMPLIIPAASRSKFLKKEKPLMEITGILKKHYNLDFNGYPVKTDIFNKSRISRKDLNPVGEKLIKSRQFPEKAILGSYYYFQS
jgi:putative SOS response-associated peptidase YedK